MPIENSRDILAQTLGNARFLELPDADHVFSGDAAALMADSVARWLAENL